mgnify:FL=1
MLSPHTSYPTLEMLSCGGVTVTTIFDCKTQDALLAISSDLLSAVPNPAAIAEKIILAARRIVEDERQPAKAKLHDNWDSALKKTIMRIDETVAEMRRTAVSQKLNGEQ